MHTKWVFHQVFRLRNQRDAPYVGKKREESKLKITLIDAFYSVLDLVLFL